MDICLLFDSWRSLQLQRLQPWHSQFKYLNRCMQKACLYYEALQNWCFKCMENCWVGQSSLPFTMGYPYLPFKDFHDNDHSVAGCISGFGRLLIFSAHKISKYLLLLLFFPPAFLTIHAHEAQRATFYRGLSHCRITVLCFELLRACLV